MSAIRDWFFEGYKGVSEPKNGGGEKRKLVYVGVWYGFAPPISLKRRKLETAALTALVLAANLYAQFVPGVGGLIAWIGAAANLTLFPMIFVLIGQVCFLTVGEKWEVRNYYAGYRRLFRWGIGLLVLTGIWAVLELLFVILNPTVFATDRAYLAAILISCAAQAVQVALIAKNPAYVVQGPVIE